MTEWIWLIIGATWGIWVNLNDANYYKKIVELQQRYIEALHNRLYGEDYD